MKKLLLAALLFLGVQGVARATPTVIASTSTPSGYATAPSSTSFVASDNVNGNSFVSTGREILVVYNAGSSATLTVSSVADASGRTGDLTQVVGAGAYFVTQMFPITGWRQTDGTIHLTTTASTLQIMVIHFP